MFADIQVQMRNGHQYADVEVPNGNYTYCDVPRHPPSNLDKGVNKANNVNKKLNKKPRFLRKKSELGACSRLGYLDGRSVRRRTIISVQCSEIGEMLLVDICTGVAG